MYLSIPILFVVGFVLYLSFRMVRTVEVRRTHRLPEADLAERTRRLEEQMMLLSDQMQRVVESQEFTTKLLSDRK